MNDIDKINEHLQLARGLAEFNIGPYKVALELTQEISRSQARLMRLRLDEREAALRITVEYFKAIRYAHMKRTLRQYA